MAAGRGNFPGRKGAIKKRKQRVRDPNWKGGPTVAIFQHGFRFLKKDRHLLEKLSKKEIKHFFDRLCELLAASVVW